MQFLSNFVTALKVNTDNSVGSVDWSIEGMRSQSFSEAIFYFLLLGIVLFTVIVILFMPRKKGSKMKTGEKWLFTWIFLGIVFAVIIGALQLLDGYLL